MAASSRGLSTPPSRRRASISSRERARFMPCPVYHMRRLGPARPRRSGWRSEVEVRRWVVGQLPEDPGLLPAAVELVRRLDRLLEHALEAFQVVPLESLEQ